MSTRAKKRSPNPQGRVASIRWIITAVVVTLITMSVIGVGWVAERNAREALTAEAEARLLLEARNLALLSVDPLLTEYPELTLYPAVSEVLEDRPDLAFAVVVDHKGIIQGHVDARLLGTPYQEDKSYSSVTTTQELQQGESLLGDAAMLVASVPVTHANGQVLGSAWVGLKRSYLEAVVTRSRDELVYITAALLAAGIASALFLMSLLLRPVAALRKGLERIGRGDLDTPMHLRDRTELGLLADTVNDMASNLKSAREESRLKEQEIVDTQKEVILTLGGVVGSRSKETGDHIVRVGEYSALLARLAGLSQEDAEILRQASPMHDVGKIGIPDQILLKPGKLTPTEFEQMQTHTTIGYNILKKSKRPMLKAAAIIALQHHEKWDGTGYPQRLKGEEIHIFGRIVGLADVFDALSCDRVYRKAIPHEEVLEVIKQDRGTHFDPKLVDLFLSHLPEFLAIRDTHAPRKIYRPSERELEPEPVLV